MGADKQSLASMPRRLIAVCHGGWSLFRAAADSVVWLQAPATRCPRQCLSSRPLIPSRGHFWGPRTSAAVHQQWCHPCTGAML